MNEFEFSSYHVSPNIPDAAKDAFGLRLKAAIARMSKERSLASLFIKEGVLQAYVLRDGLNLSVETNLVIG